MIIRFMAGLPRTGTTLLAAIMNQDARVYVSPQSDLSEHMRLSHQAYDETVRLGVLRDERDALMRSMPFAFYSAHNVEVVIDKSRRWGTPYYLRLLCGTLSDQPRILCPVRPLSEVVASFVRKAQENPETNYIDKQMREEDFLPLWRKPIDDARVDWLLQPGGLLDHSMLSVASAYASDTANMFHIFTYDDLVHKPQETLDAIYSFIGIDPYTYDFSVIPEAEKHNDLDILGIPDMHRVRNILCDTAPNPEDILSDYAMTRCAIEDFWTNR